MYILEEKKTDMTPVDHLLANPIDNVKKRGNFSAFRNIERVKPRKASYSGLDISDWLAPAKWRTV